jgi:hypothetical protein
MAKKTVDEELAASEEPAADALMTDLAALAQEWTSHFKAQNLMVDELKALMKRHGYIEPDQA